MVGCLISCQFWLKRNSLSMFLKHSLLNSKASGNRSIGAQKSILEWLLMFVSCIYLMQKCMGNKKVKCLALHIWVWYNKLCLRVLFECKWISFEISSCWFDSSESWVECQCECFFYAGLILLLQVIPLDITVELQKQIMSELEILYKVWTSFYVCLIYLIYIYRVVLYVYFSPLFQT